MHTPKLCRHKATSQGYVTLNGREHYCGSWPRDQKKAPPGVRAEYDRLISVWLANGRRMPAEGGTAPPVRTVNGVILAFLDHAEGHYSDRGRKTGKSAEAEGIRSMCDVLTAVHGKLPVDQFGPRALKQVREKMVERDWSRNYVNKQVNRLKRMFRWAVAEELVPPSVLHGLQAVPAIRKGEPGVRETEPVKPVPDAWIEAALPHCSAQVRAMVRLQILTGARPGEVVLMRWQDIDRSGRVWVFTPEYHKNAHRGGKREVYVGPLAQAVLADWSRDHPGGESEYLFSPAEAVGAWIERKRKTRTSKVPPSQVDRSKATTKKGPGGRYSTMSYGKAVRYASRRADRAEREGRVAAARLANPAADVSQIEAAVYFPEWGVHRLRHNAATAIRKELGIEMAQLALGHASMAATQVYAERDRARIMDVFERMG